MHQPSHATWNPSHEDLESAPLTHECQPNYGISAPLTHERQPYYGISADR